MPSTRWCSLFNCCYPSASSSELTTRNQELQKTISELTKRNQELEANVASLSEENAKFVSRSAKEKKNKTERRNTFKSKLANMSEKLKGEFGDDFDEVQSSSTSEKDISS